MEEIHLEGSSSSSLSLHSPRHASLKRVALQEKGGRRRGPRKTEEPEDEAVTEMKKTLKQQKERNMTAVKSREDEMQRVQSCLRE